MVADGLRATIRQKDTIIETKDREIGSLRNAVAPGFFIRLKQEAELVTVTAVIAATLTFVLTR